MKKVNIVFLDASTVDYNDISLQKIKSLGHLKIYPTTKPKDILKRIKSANIVITNKCVLSDDIISKSPNLKLICVAATGTNNLDLDSARRNNIAVSNVAGYSTESVVQLTFGFIISMSTHLPLYIGSTPKKWPKSKIFTLPLLPTTELSGKTLGIIGYGTIGKRVSKVAQSFGMRVLIAKIPGRKYKSGSLKRVSLKDISKKSDFITLHAPSTKLTKNLVNNSFLKDTKKGSCIINMARGDLLDEVATSKFLKKGHLGYLASDVLTKEPPSANNPLLHAPRVFLTPHIGWASLEARKRLIEEIHTNIKAYLKGQKRNRVV